MTRIKSGFMSTLLFIVLYLFIAVDIINGAGRVPRVFEILNSILLALFFLLLVVNFILMIRSSRRIDRIQILVLSIMLWQLMVASFNPDTIALNMLYQIMGWPLLFVIVYDLTKRKKFPLPDFKPYFALWVLASIYVVYVLRTQMFNDVYRTYYLIVAVPFYFYKKDKWKYLRLIATAAIILFTYKRTAFVALLAGTFVFFISDIYVQRKQFKKYKKTIALFALIFVMGMLFYHYSENIAVFRRMQRIFSDNGSDRFIIWETLFKHFKSEGIINKLMGNGYEGCRIVLNGTFAAAHNDFIEHLIDYGVIDLLLITLFLGVMAKYLVKYFKLKLTDAPCFAYMLLVLLFLMLFSFATWQSILMKPIAMYLAYMVANLKYGNVVMSPDKIGASH